jgi:plastocyanin/predicted small secreted protein
MNRTRIVTVALLLACLVAAGCGKSNKVGSGVKVGKGGSNQGALGRETTTTAGPSTTAAGKATTTTAGKATTTTARATTTTAPQQAALTIKIQSDAADHAFEPTQASVTHGSIVKWVNADTQPRSVVAANGAFSSGPLAPGASYEFKTGATGTYNYGDGTRPYAQGQLIVS